MIKKAIDIIYAYKNPAYSLFRIIVGALFLQHGLQKFGLLGTFSMSQFASFAGIPLWLAYIVSTVELLGGTLIVLGLATRLAVIATSIDMIGALIIIHFPQGPIPLFNQGELALLYLISFLLILFKGSGELSLDRFIFKNKNL